MILLGLRIFRIFSVESPCGVREDVIHELLIGTKQRALVSNAVNQSTLCRLHLMRSTGDALLVYNMMKQEREYAIV